ncbi:Carboxypeptidase regulatory-like domain-containing protein [Geodermatophilus saharensis]|uniref:Carboxypeptidase regulatory-like domain-containing protein n=1 Tax=Geodermatophilus saharensis TaxID=1137994 RepID=A0A239C6Y5_9ACTN|nr:Pvc16 family protein [Geodermatophilus saharensis]SNS15381.1 Carboxypeptidase regulatory-like domain-containing protein [Geodermatophilus saharensis]
MFADLDATLRAILDDPAAPAPVRAAEVSFDPPDRDFTPGQATVNLFLHEVVENRGLRETGPFVERDGPGEAAGYRFTAPPLRVDCTYLVTAWSARTREEKTEEEHTLLGTALLWLARFVVVDDRFLQGTLADPPQPYPLSLTVAQTREHPGAGEFWSALGVAPRPAFSLTVTVSLQPVEDEAEFPAVQEIHPVMVSRTDPVLTGRVLDAALAPVPGAQVTVVEAGRDTTADATGRFTVAGLAFRRYTLRVVAGTHDESRTVDYGAASQVHDMVLPDS